MIKYKLLKSELTGTIYAQQVDSQTFTTDDLNDKLKEKFGAIAPAVFDEAIRIINDKLGEGNTVSIDDFGTMSVRLELTDKNITAFEDVRTQDICVNGIRFVASKNLRNYLKNNEIHVMKGDKVLRKLTTDERWVIIYDYLLMERESKGSATIGVSTYRYLTGCTDYTARKELESFVKEGKLRRIPIRRVNVYALALS